MKNPVFASSVLFFHKNRSFQPLLILFFVLVLASSFTKSANAENGVLWAIEKQNQKKSYLLGTVHIGDPRVINFKPELNQVLSTVSSISIETKLDPEAQMAAAMRMFAPGSNLEKSVGSEYFKKIAAELQKYQMPPEMASQLKPWAAMITLSVPPNMETSVFMDAKIYNYGLNNNKKVYGLETLDEQLSIFDSMALEDQVMLLKQTIDDLPKRDNLMEKMLSLYLEGDLQQLEKLNEEQIQQADSEMVKNLMVRLLDDRNKKMVQRMNPRLLEGNALIAVGALHLPGEKGILQLLKQKGYTVKPVY